MFFAKHSAVDLPAWARQVVSPDGLIELALIGPPTRPFTGMMVCVYANGTRVVQHYMDGLLHHDTAPALVYAVKHDEHSYWCCRGHVCRDKDQFRLLAGHVPVPESFSVLGYYEEDDGHHPVRRILAVSDIVESELQHFWLPVTRLVLKSGRVFICYNDYHTDIEFVRRHEEG